MLTVINEVVNVVKVIVRCCLGPENNWM